MERTIRVFPVVAVGGAVVGGPIEEEVVNGKAICFLGFFIIWFILRASVVIRILLK